MHQTEEDLKELEADEHVCHICKQSFPLRAMLMQHVVNCQTDTDIIGIIFGSFFFVLHNFVSLFPRNDSTSIDSETKTEKKG